MAKRLAGRCGYPADDPFRPGVLHADKRYDPMQWKRPARVFVSSMGDLFHDAVKNSDVRDVWQVMKAAPQHTFMILTKRPRNMLSVVGDFAMDLNLGVLPNVWLGVSASTQSDADQNIYWLLQVPAAKRFVSYEPALGPVEWSWWFKTFILHYGGDGWHATTCTGKPRAGIDWLIAGAETGPGARPAHPDWFRSARDQCQAAGVPFFLKKINAAGHRLLDGAMHEEWPEGDDGVKCPCWEPAQDGEK